MAFLPFPTRLIADGPCITPPNESVYVTMYGLTLLAIRLLGAALDAYARREHLYSPHQDREELAQRHGGKLLPVVIGYVIAILIGLVLPEVAVALVLRYRGVRWSCRSGRPHGCCSGAHKPRGLMRGGDRAAP